jgi:hypothetical protein
MRVTLCAVLLVGLFLAPGSWAATGRVIKVLPHFIDDKGRISLSPSLFERDAYQARLRAHPEQRDGLRYSVQYKTRKGSFEPLKVRVELRGAAEGNLPKSQLLEKRVESSGWFSRWVHLDLVGEEFKEFGEVTAWRVTLWEGEQLLGEQRSFLW